MTYQRTSRALRHAKYAKQKVTRVPTIYGLLYNVLAFFSMARLGRFLMRKPWHVADLYRGGRFEQALYVFPRETRKQRMERESLNIEKFLNSRGMTTNKPKHPRP